LDAGVEGSIDAVVERESRFVKTAHDLDATAG